MSGRLGFGVPASDGGAWSSRSWAGLGGEMAFGEGCPTGVVMVTSSSSMETFSWIMHQFAPSLRLMHRLEPVRVCQSLGPLSTFRRVKLCQFSEYLDAAALFLPVDCPRIRPKIHLPGVSNSCRSVKAMKWWSLAVVLVPRA